MFKDIFNELLQINGLNQSQFAKKANIPITTVSGWLNAGRLPDYNAIKKIATFFEVSADYIIENSDEWGNVTISSGNVTGNNNTVNSHNVIRSRSDPKLSTADAELLHKYHAAPTEIRKAIDKLLS